MELVRQIFEVCIFPLLAILTKFAIDYLNAKRQEVKTQTESELAKKYTDMITDTITKCVIATNQTYVDSLKHAGVFDKETQAEAFRKTYEAVMVILSDEAKTYIKETMGDMTTYLMTQIEATVNENKESA